MSAEHMGMVFKAEGIDGSEKLLLLAYTNYTDPYGYCWPSEDRLVDDCGTSPSTVRRAKRDLKKKNLVKSVRRVSKSTGDPISNLTRVNLPLLASMARKRATYDDNLINAISFDDDTQGDPETTLTGTPDEPGTTPDLLTGHSDLRGESGSDLLKGQIDLSLRSDRSVAEINLTSGSGQSDLHIPYSSLKDPSLSGAAPVTEAAAPVVTPASERETSAAPGQQTRSTSLAAGFVLPGQRVQSQEEQDVEIVLKRYLAEAGKPVTNWIRGKIKKSARELLAKHPVEWVADRAAECAQSGWTDLIKHAEHIARQQPAAAAPEASRGSRLVDWCGECNRGRKPNSAAERFRELPDGRDIPCPSCHPKHSRATA
ncbi:helix-turn-helix domain-containing protein [Streptomyces goshikiensis]|uniref:helix-turn-helix domain-containing protein n=1 Tax=Streptomyces goshikiensis TaxID=1942 RepID=UPI003813EA9D